MENNKRETPQERYAKKNLKGISFRLSLKNDEEVLNQIEKQENKADYFRFLVTNDIYLKKLEKKLEKRELLALHMLVEFIPYGESVKYDNYDYEVLYSLYKTDCITINSKKCGFKINMICYLDENDVMEAVDIDTLKRVSSDTLEQMFPKE